MAGFHKRAIWLLAVSFGLAFVSGCGSSPEPDSQPTSTAVPVKSPTPTDVSPPQPTRDASVQPYLENVEEILRHSAVVIKDRAVGIPDACPGLYIMAFPYSEPDHRGGMTIAETGLERNEDGSIVFKEHEYLWNLKGEGVEPERCKDIYIQDRSELGFIQISFQVQHPDDRSWRIGVASGPCPGIDLWLAAYFFLENPDDFDLLISQFDPDSPKDYWLRDGSLLHRYQWEPWQETLLWTLEDVPGKLRDVAWSQDSGDLSGDGEPDLLLTWEDGGQLVSWIYSPEGSGFTLFGEYSAVD